jgi:predicted acylesterase/phospholipase RssA
MNWNQIEHLVISGGGPRVFSYCGVLEQLDHFSIAITGENLHSKIQSGAGTSIGALTVFAFLSGMPVTDFLRIIRKAPLWNANELITQVELLGMLQKGGVCKTELLVDMVKQIYEYFDYPLDLTFEQWYDMTGKKLFVNTTNSDTQAMKLFSVDDTPGDIVFDVLVATMCIPILFQPYTYRDRSYVDGGVTCNYLAHLFDPSKTIGILYAETENESGDKPKQPTETPTTDAKSKLMSKNILSIILNTMECMSWQLQKAQFKMLPEEMKNNTIHVYPNHIITYTGMFQFNQEHIERMFYYGCSKAVWHFYQKEWMTAFALHYILGFHGMKKPKAAEQTIATNKNNETTTNEDEKFMNNAE